MAIERDKDPANETVRLTTQAGARADIRPYGAHVISWRAAGDAAERLFLSDKAKFEAGAAVRGGVPVIFPQFSDRGPLPKHGFARVRHWQLLSASELDEHTAQAVFALSSDEQTREIWPHNFAASYTVTLTDKQLDMQLKVTNTGAETFRFTAGLHTYLAVGEIRAAKVYGLTGSAFWDNDGSDPTSEPGTKFQTERREVITLAGPMDRVYHRADSPLRLSSPTQTTELYAQGFEDTVVWNPGAQGSASMSDMSEHGYRDMLCIEAATVMQPIELDSNNSWTGSQTLAAC